MARGEGGVTLTERKDREIPFVAEQPQLFVVNEMEGRPRCLAGTNNAILGAT